MGIRGFIRDIIGIYLGFEIIKGAITKNFQITTPIIVSAAILFGFRHMVHSRKDGNNPKL